MRVVRVVILEHFVFPEFKGVAFSFSPSSVMIAEFVIYDLNYVKVCFFYVPIALPGSSSLWAGAME